MWWFNIKTETQSEDNLEMTEFLTLLAILSYIKADLQSVLRTLKSLFLFFVLLQVRYYKM